ncbi:Long-chain-fatty-acid--CoA ligase [Variovorax sp. PBL-H6]|uniref:AMP-binding protein n=1 Tax=Variovorax sp. PBL-H6 TaxID=434009 RepID=UPI0013188291|nr:AMP-binding protein [Variovorax sp. PBL-H6]VTU32001.1 Long-chain-fatty-acid--CoA ligase [Variovorax sp. PBL-H6]
MTSNLAAVGADTYALRDLTFPKVLQRQANDSPDKVFLTETATGRRFSFREMDLWSNRVANALADLGVARGRHTGVLMGNSAEHLAIFFGIGKLGAVSVPVNTAARGELLRYYLTQSDCDSVVVDDALVDRLAEVLPQLPLVRRVLVVRTAEAAAHALAASPACEVADFETCIASAGDAPRGAEVKCSDLLMLAYTSGTTGPSKGSMLSHAAALTYGTSAAEAQGYRTSDVFYVCLPLFHNNALLAATAAALVCGASVVLSRRFSVSKFWGEIRESHATITNFLGAMSSFLWSSPPSPDDADNDLRLVSMAPTPKYAAEFEKRFGLKAMNNYGLSDFGMVTSFTANEPREKLGSIGKPRRGFRVKIVDEDDFELPAGEVGEMVLQSDDPWRATNGYYKMPEATLAANRNQWFHTGDRGMIDADGYFWFVDRKKDCIRRRGENISAFEVEQIIATHPEVANAAVFPVATQTNDEEVGAVVVLKSGAAVSEKELVEHCQRNMAYFMVPRYIQFRDQLPTTVNQKVEKFRLRSELERDLSKAWDREAAGLVLAR